MNRTRHSIAPSLSKSNVGKEVDDVAAKLMTALKETNWQIALT
jgi:hypothetical protein